MIIAESNTIDKKKVGIVTFVGNAARLVISAIAIAAIPKAKRSRLFPVYMTTNNVSGVMKHAWVASAIPNQRNRLSSWLAHQLIKRVQIEVF